MLKPDYLMKFSVKSYVYGLRAKITCLKRPLKAILFMLVLFLGVVRAEAVTHDLRSVLEEATGNYVILNSEDTYVLDNGEYWFFEDMAINGNGATIELHYPIKAYEPEITLTIDHCIISSTGWGALCGVRGSNIIVQNNSEISCGGGTGIHIDSSTLTVRDSSITSCFIGISLNEDSDGSTAEVHNVTIIDCPYAVQVVGHSSSVTIDQNSHLEYTGVGTGVGILEGASGVVHDSTLIGFSNAIDVRSSEVTGEGLQQHPLAGTIEVRRSYFDNQAVAAVSAIDAHNVLVSKCKVQDTREDGLFFSRCTGKVIVELTEILNSLNTGITFWGCAEGAILRNCLIKGSLQQGLSIMADHGTPTYSSPRDTSQMINSKSDSLALSEDSPPVGSKDIQVMNNAIIGSHGTDLVIDEWSTGQFQGNILGQGPDPTMSTTVRLHGAQGITLNSALLLESPFWAMEMKKSSTATIALSSIWENNPYGIVAYDNSFLTLENSFLWRNSLSGNGWAVYVDGGATVNTQYCTFGPALWNGFFNWGGSSCDIEYNYWEASDGPDLSAMGLSGGSGSRLAWNLSGWSPVSYVPWLTQAPVESNVNTNVSLPSGGSLSWDSTLGVTASLTSETDSTALSNEIAGVLRVNDTDHLNSVTPPSGLLSGQLYVVWVSAALCMNSSSGYLKFSIPLDVFEAELLRREMDGSWTQVVGIWDRVSNVLTYSPTDMHLLNGTFALIDVTPDLVYVEPYGYCDGNQPCFSDIQNAIDYAWTAVSDIWICQGTYIGDIFVEGSQKLSFQYGWNRSFTEISSKSEVNGKMTIEGTVTLPWGTLVLQ